ncbi:MAG: ADP-ribosylglycohydrolase family protein [Sedimentisphaerales bacterium]
MKPVRDKYLNELKKINKIEKLPIIGCPQKRLVSNGLKKRILLTAILISVIGANAMALGKAGQNVIEVGDFKLIYDPSVGEKEKWYINDHCFIYDTKGTWHLFGITHQEPANPIDEDNFAHATAAKLTQSPWKKEPFALSTDPNWHEEHLWAPDVIFHNGLYYMYYCAGDKNHSKYKIHLATSKNLYDWQRHPANPMVVDGFDARDPYILRLNDKWIMYYTATSKPTGGNHIVAAVTSTDLIHWKDKKIVFTDPCVSTWGGPTESPTVIRRGKYYYLFIGPRDNYRGTCVYRSENPFEFKNKNLVAKINSHAAEVLRDTDGNWFISHCGWGQGGVYLATLKWNDGVDNNDTSLPVPPANAGLTQNTQNFKKISVKTYRDKMMAGWVGQMAGVSFGAPTEFKFADKIIPADAMPKWKPKLINDAFAQDDLYVEMTFLRTLEQYGIGVSIRQAGIDFANSGYPLWCANNAGRTNLRRGIAPPDSSHPKFNRCPDDIDYQIEADYSGLIAPGLPQNAVVMGEKFGRLMNYGDGMYAGQFIGAMYSAAFFETDPVKIIESALKAIPAGSQYAEMVRDMLAWYQANPDDWEKTWHLAQKKYRENPEYQKASNGGIDCKINGAYVLMGLLYGKGDLDQTMTIACRCGQDSDCDPSSAAGVIFTTVGFSGLPEHFTEQLNKKTIFSNTAYSFPALINVCEKLARQVIANAGGKVEKDTDGQEVFVIPVRPVVPSRLQLSWAPEPIADSRFTEAEKKQITRRNLPEHMPKAVAKFAPGWKIADCGTDMNPGLRAEYRGRKNVLVTHPLDPDTGCVLSRKLMPPAGKKITLRIVVGNDPQGDFDLIVRANGRQLLRKPVSSQTAKDGWLTEELDLSAYAGKPLNVEVVNQPTGWSYEAAYWAEIAFVTQ